MRRIRILHLAQCAGGVDCYLRMLLANMDRERFENVVVCSYDYARDDYASVADEFIQIDMCNSLSLSKDIAAVRRVRRLIRELRPDIVYCHSSKAGGVGRLAGVGLGVPGV
ncbi:MAG: glycosyltransferase, partial [Prevotellaceae bacterium]|nr:glycosyltransferase [Prevotellaceae bacterium]